ncbi:MAG: XRE family transcriptional regulator [Lachnospiraceae bacterium]|nr:XRE family transcriptional regulator [Lachnospiraceae bacterium]
MLSENIKHFRKAKGISQEEMAVKLNVVRQTVSKWENGLSVPDADILIHIAELLDVSVSQLLGVEMESKSTEDLSEELAKLNEQLAQKNQKEKLLLQANKKRSLILGFSFLAMLIALLVQNEVISILLVGVCLCTAVIVLYRNMALLTSITTDDMRIGMLRITTFFDIGVLAVGIVFALLSVFDMIPFSENGEEIFAIALVSCMILFAGVVLPKLPYTRHTGLRLPWTVQDEDTWNVAHRIIGYISFPTVLLYLACAWTIPNLEIVTTCTVIIWIGIPGAISYVFFYKKYKN